MKETKFGIRVHFADWFIPELEEIEEDEKPNSNVRSGIINGSRLVNLHLLVYLSAVFGQRCMGECIVYNTIESSRSHILKRHRARNQAVSRDIRLEEPLQPPRLQYLIFNQPSRLFSLYRKLASSLLPVP